MDDVRIVDHVACDTAVVRVQIPLADLPAFFARAYPAVLAVLAGQGRAPVGPPFAWYAGPPTDEVYLEAGFPVDAPIEATGEVVPSHLPGGRAATAVHVGPYSTMTATYDMLRGWILAHGLIPTVAMWETYLTDPAADPDPSTWRTEIHWPIS